MGTIGKPKKSAHQGPLLELYAAAGATHPCIEEIVFWGLGPTASKMARVPWRFPYSIMGPGWVGTLVGDSWGRGLEFYVVVDLE